MMPRKRSQSSTASSSQVVRFALAWATTSSHPSLPPIFSATSRSRRLAIKALLSAVPEVVARMLVAQVVSSTEPMVGMTVVLAAPLLWTTPTWLASTSSKLIATS